jgi:hypothetical protein
MRARYVCRVSELCVMAKDVNGAREGERSSQIGLLLCELNLLPFPGARVGSSTQSLNLPSVPIEAMRFGWMVGGSHCIFAQH